MKAFTIATPRYVIKRKKEEHLNIFYTHERAIEEAIVMACSHPGDTFYVIKKVNDKESEIFSCCINMQFDLSLTQKVYKKIVSIFEAKLISIQQWRV